ncbi:hypothetical protein AB0N24_27130 [Arthrobacter sp. NPDC093128]|uniref:hypothetical protein n=1 Tax=Arthrobacter sp. NPDC093128 TaxID=3154979 RepID=UPI003416BDA7
MTHALVVCRDTEEEARAGHRQIIEEGDWAGARNVMSALGMESESFAAQIEKYQERFMAGAASTVSVRPSKWSRSSGSSPRPEWTAQS